MFFIWFLNLFLNQLKCNMNSWLLEEVLWGSFNIMQEKLIFIPILKSEKMKNHLYWTSVENELSLMPGQSLLVAN